MYGCSPPRKHNDGGGAAAKTAANRAAIFVWLLHTLTHTLHLLPAALEWGRVPVRALSRSTAATAELERPCRSSLEACGLILVCESTVEDRRVNNYRKVAAIVMPRSQSPQVGSTSTVFSG